MSTKTFETAIDDNAWKWRHCEPMLKCENCQRCQANVREVLLAAHQADLDAKVREFAELLKAVAVENGRTHANMGFVVDADDIDSVLA